MAEMFVTNGASAPASAACQAPVMVKIWHINLGVTDDEAIALSNLLSRDELLRAQRFLSDKLRNRYIAGRAMLRQILANELSAFPQDLAFEVGPAGKPSLATLSQNGSPQEGLEFNLAHCEEHALLASAQGCAIGVDIERVRWLDDAGELVSQFFSRREAAIFNVLSVPDQAQAFFNLWTRKEALLKATGEGIAHSLNRVEVTFLPKSPAKILAVPSSFGEISDWTLLKVEFVPGHAAALAVRNHGRPLRWIRGSELAQHH